MKHLYSIILLLIFIGIYGPAEAQDYIFANQETVRICPATDETTLPERYDIAPCQSANPMQIDPHKKTIWVHGSVFLSSQDLQSRKAAYFFISVKGASRVYVNDNLVGSNGVPSMTRDKESPGQLDFSLFVPRKFLKEGQNNVTVLISGHHSHFPFSHTLHRLGIGFDIHPQNRLLLKYWPSILCFGVFIIGGFYFLAISLFRYRSLEKDVWGLVALGMASIFAAGQLIAEILRGVWAYPYPFHDIRLCLILILASCAGLCLDYHVLRKFAVRHTPLILALISIVMLMCVLFLAGFDTKTSWVILVGTLSAALISFCHVRYQRKDAIIYGSVFTGFIVLNFIAPEQFLDTNYYFLLSLLFLTLFVLQAQRLWRFERDYSVSETKRHQLELVLENLSDPETKFLQIDSSGRKDRIRLSDIIVISAAGDYVALNLQSGKEILYNSSLAILEKELPSSFLRVHRSHIVNTDEIVSLIRHAGGTGELELKTGQTIPVSRRIMPRVRRSLDDLNFIDL